MSLQALKVQLRMSGQEISSIGGTSIQANLDLDRVTEYEDGTGDNAAQKTAHYNQTFGTGGTSIDLTAAQGVNGTVNFSKIKEIMVFNDDADATKYLIIGAAGTNAFTAPFGDASDTLKCMAKGGEVRIKDPAGWVVDATHKLLKIASAAGTPTGRVVVIGEGT